MTLPSTAKSLLFAIKVEELIDSLELSQLFNISLRHTQKMLKILRESGLAVKMNDHYCITPFGLEILGN